MHFEEQLHELIAKRAHELSHQSPGNSNNHQDDWHQAEQEIYKELDLRSDELFRKIDMHEELPANLFLHDPVRD